MNAIDADDSVNSTNYVQKLLDVLIPYVSMPPLDGAEQQGKSECISIQTTSDDEFDCNQYPAAFTGSSRSVRSDR